MCSPDAFLPEPERRTIPVTWNWDVRIGEATIERNDQGLIAHITFDHDEAIALLDQHMPSMSFSIPRRIEIIDLEPKWPRDSRSP